ncbi:glycerate kinase [Vibrio owensii]
MCGCSYLIIITKFFLYRTCYDFKLSIVATLRSGIGIVTDAVGLERGIKDSDIVVTAEGRMDSQTLHGKTPIGVAKLAKKYNTPVVVFAGYLGGAGVSAVHEHGIDAVFPTISKLDSLDKTLKNASIDLERTARNAAAMIGLYK